MLIHVNTLRLVHQNTNLLRAAEKQAGLLAWGWCTGGLMRGFAHPLGQFSRFLGAELAALFVLNNPRANDAGCSALAVHVLLRQNLQRDEAPIDDVVRLDRLAARHRRGSVRCGRPPRDGPLPHHFHTIVELARAALPDMLRPQRSAAPSDATKRFALLVGEARFFAFFKKLKLKKTKN